MTRRERLTEYVTGLVAPVATPDLIPIIVATVLKITDDRTFLTTADMSRYLGRSANTIITWRDRGTHRLPAPAYHQGQGPIWDREDVDEWCARNPKLLGQGADYYLDRATVS